MDMKPESGAQGEARRDADLRRKVDCSFAANGRKIGVFAWSLVAGAAMIILIIMTAYSANIQV